MGKTVYILGAGFSKGLGAPLQNELVKEIFSVDEKELNPDLSRLFLEKRRGFQSFLEDTLFIPVEKFKDVALEDLYTPIDRCILDNVSFRDRSKSSLIDLRYMINALLTILIHQKLKNIVHPNYIDDFARFLVDIKNRKNNNDDPFSVISLNWDILIDNAINRELDNNEGVIDYCCHITPFNPDQSIMPGLLARGKGMFNLKLLKLHGSMNWLQCQRCQRLFVAFGEKIALHEYLTKPKCRLCKKNFTNDGNGALLVSQLIMPTFLKDFNNVQLKLIWHNAGIELSEASKVVFMGYSFPAADFELRQLLSRTVRHDAKIDVVLKDKPKKAWVDYPEKRYRDFFGKRDVVTYYSGVEEYIRDLSSHQP